MPDSAETRPTAHTLKSSLRESNGGHEKRVSAKRLASLKNFAANGRISPALAKIVGVLGIRIVGIASREGTLEPIHKPRGEAKALKSIFDHLVDSGLQQGKVWIAHCENPTAADTLAGMLREALPQVTVQIHPCRGLCSYYAEKHGMLVGFEKF